MIQPTIIAGIRDAKTGIVQTTPTKIIKQIFRPETSEALKTALFNVVDQEAEAKYARVE